MDLKEIKCSTGESYKTGHFYSFTDPQNAYEILLSLGNLKLRLLIYLQHIFFSHNIQVLCHDQL